MTVAEQHAHALAIRYAHRGITPAHLDRLDAMHADRHDRAARKENDQGLALTACSDDLRTSGGDDQ